MGMGQQHRQRTRDRAFENRRNPTMDERKRDYGTSCFMEGIVSVGLTIQAFCFAPFVCQHPIDQFRVIIPSQTIQSLWLSYSLGPLSLHQLFYIYQLAKSIELS